MIFLFYLDGVYDEAECKSVAHNRLSEVLKILKEILGKYPPLHSSDILTAASAIIKKIKTYNYADGKDGPLEYNNAIDQLALSFSSRCVTFFFVIRGTILCLDFLFPSYVSLILHFTLDKTNTDSKSWQYRFVISKNLSLYIKLL